MLSHDLHDLDDVDVETHGQADAGHRFLPEEAVSVQHRQLIIEMVDILLGLRERPASVR